MRMVAVLPAILPILLATASGCGSGGSQDSAAAGVGVRVEPPNALVQPSGTVAFRATVTGTAVTTVSWSVDCGSITQSGLFTAPQTSGACRITATSAGGAASGSALVSVGAGGWSSVCAAEPMRSTGTTYYACDCQAGADAKCVPGSDSNPGTSASAPLRSWSKIRDIWQSMNAGDTIALCKGGRFDGNTVQGWGWVNYRCSASPSTTCIMRDYVPTWATGGEVRPTVALSTGNSGIMIGGGPALVDGYRFLNIAFVNTSGGMGSSGNGFSLGDNSSDIEVCNCVFDGFAIGITTGLNYPSCIGTDGVRGFRRNFRGNYVLNNCADGALVEDHDSDYDGNYFDNNGHDACNNFSHLLNASGGTTHTFYLGSRCDARNVRFINNEVHRSSFYQGHCTQASVVTNGSSTGFVIENNLFDGSEPGGTCGAFFGSNTYEVATPPFHGPRNAVVRRNRIKQWGGQAIGFSSAQNALIEDNIVEIVGDMSVMWSAIGLPHAANQTAGSDMTAYGTVRNNTIYLSGTNGVDKAAIAVGTYDLVSSPTQVGFNVTGNAVYVASGTSLGSCFSTKDKASIAYMNNNLCNGAPNWANQNGTTYSLSGWQAFATVDSASSAAPPMFVNAPTDLTPAVGSPLIGAASTATTCTVAGTANQPCSSQVAIGTPTWSPLDTGVVRNSGRSIGAMER